MKHKKTRILPCLHPETLLTQFAYMKILANARTFSNILFTLLEN